MQSLLSLLWLESFDLIIDLILLKVKLAKLVSDAIALMAIQGVSVVVVVATKVLGWLKKDMVKFLNYRKYSANVFWMQH